MLLVIRRSFTKADWCFVMIDGRNFLSLFVRTLEKILYRTLHKLMGRYSDMDLGFFTLGIRIIKE